MTQFVAAPEITLNYSASAKQHPHIVPNCGCGLGRSFFRIVHGHSTFGLEFRAVA